MHTEKELTDLEQRGWQALSTASTATAFYRDVLHEDAVMLFPGGMRLAGREEILSTMDAPPWESYALTELAVSLPADGVGVVDYVVGAVRGGKPYAALVSSHYIERDGKWLLYFHQHTPKE
ncbi:nuclear transport factor 2 family protein [Phytomonospora sp. NPDC050363]|uniref:nuclear transport factor 2 family protein n=1 Tax=Phytomonospora sp. NPDC050363 TaxID=3155642 RepID=UPI0033D5FFD6